MLGAAESFSTWDKTHFWTSKHTLVHMTNSAAKPGAMQHSTRVRCHFLQYRRCERFLYTSANNVHLHTRLNFLLWGSTLAKKRKVNQPRVLLVHWAKALWSKQSKHCWQENMTTTQRKDSLERLPAPVWKTKLTIRHKNRWNHYFSWSFLFSP